jgi:tetratricopeptide (TPR) repeat protein
VLKRGQLILLDAQDKAADETSLLVNYLTLFLVIIMSDKIEKDVNNLEAIATLVRGLQYEKDADNAKAAYYLEQAATSFNALWPIAGKHLMSMYYHGGNGVTNNSERALQYAELGLSAAIGEYDVEQSIEDKKGIISYMFLIGNGLCIEGNYGRALGLYERMLELQDTPSFVRCNILHDIGTFYKGGFGVKQDFSRAFSYFEKASSTACEPNNYEVKFGNCGEACHDTTVKSLSIPRSELGKMYIFGKGVERDAIKGIELLESANNIYPQSSTAELLCIIYTKGMPGMEPDLNKAAQYCEEEFL